MEVIERKPVPMYEVTCHECKSIIQYKASEMGEHEFPGKDGGKRMSTVCPQIVKCGWCNPYCSERIKINSLRELEKDWWGYGKNSRVVVRDEEV